MNKVQLLGRIGTTEFKTLPSGTKVGNISLATTKRGYIKQDGAVVPEETTWHQIVLWGNLSDVVEKYTTIGDRLFVEGEIFTQEWEDDNKNKRIAFRIRAKEIELIEPPVKKEQQENTTV
ncbi:MAG: single-stranded DNA-binding protein [Bacteroidales bacterium]